MMLTFTLGLCGALIPGRLIDSSVKAGFKWFVRLRVCLISFMIECHTSLLNDWFCDRLKMKLASIV